MANAFVTYGGWEGHDPAGCSEWCRQVLEAEGFDVDVADTLAPLADPGYADRLDLVIPVWSLVELPETEVDALVAAVSGGVGFAAFHGAAATFMTHRAYRQLIGGTFVWHPDERKFLVDTRRGDSFAVSTEQYYLHVDPANEVVATTSFEHGTLMPVAWKRTHEQGRVFYSALGHSRAVLELQPVRDLFLQGVRWAARQPDE